MADGVQSGISEIDALLDQEGKPPIGPGSPPLAVGAVQELLLGQGVLNPPRINDDAAMTKILAKKPHLRPTPAADHAEIPYKNYHGLLFGNQTLGALHRFQRRHGLPMVDVADQATLRALVAVPPRIPIASRAYLSRVVGLRYAGFVEIASLVALGEVERELLRPGFNSDKQGLSLGILHWVQSRGRLAGLFEAIRAKHQATMEAIFGKDNLAEIMAFVQLGGAGLTSQGKPKDAQYQPYDLCDPALGWREKIEALIRRPEVQRTIVEKAVVDLRATKAVVDAGATGVGTGTATMRSVRGVGYLLDLANQVGDHGAKSMYKHALATNPTTERDIMASLLVQAFDRIEAAQQKNGWTDTYTRSVKYSRLRRSRFYYHAPTPWLSDDPFVDS